MRVVVLGGYGFIGLAVVRGLLRRGHAVTGVGRDAATGRRLCAAADWVGLDIARAGAAELAALVGGADAVVNASGALQDAPGADLRAIHVDAVARIAAALGRRAVPVVQISAAGGRPDAATAFMATKGEGDAALRAARPDAVILRPVLVLGPDAWGGSALLRAAAALPIVLPRVFPGAMIRTVALEDVVGAVVAAVEGRLPAGLTADLTEAGAQDLPGLIRTLRGHMGFAPARAEIRVPHWALRALGSGADALALFGWRSPLRTTALRVLEAGITGDPGPWAAAGGPPCRGLADTLALMPATLQERWFARAWLMRPLAIATLALFWLGSGLVGLWQVEAAAAVLTLRGWSAGAAEAAAIAGAILDIGLGAAVIWKRRVRVACLGMVLLSLGYLAAGTIAASDLWADPLGPFLKVLPGIMLALFTAALPEER